MLDVHTSNVDDFLSRDTCVSTIHLNRPICNKMCISALENPDRLVLFLS
jgi:hypothetical protein